MNNDLDTLRQKIAAIDARVLELVAKRLQLARHAGQYKCQQRIAITDSAVEELILQQNLRVGQDLQLPSELVHSLTTLLIAYATRVQQEATYKKKPERAHLRRHSCSQP